MSMFGSSNLLSHDVLDAVAGNTQFTASKLEPFNILLVLGLIAKGVPLTPFWDLQRTR